MSEFKNEVLLKLQKLDKDTLAKVARALEHVEVRYDISRKESALAVRSQDGLPEPVKYYLVSKKMEGLSAKSLELYHLYLQNFFTAVCKPLNEITANDIRVYLYRYQEVRGISNRTLDTMRTVIATCFGWMAAEEYLMRDPCKTVKPIRYEAKHKSALTQMELEHIRHACATERETALVEFLYSTGCRASEVAGAKISDIDWINRELVVLGKGHKHRTVFLNAKAVVSLKAYIAKRSDATDAIFVADRAPYNPLTVSGIERIIGLIARRCPDITKAVSPHVFRHTTATIALQSGMPVQDVQRVLGHSQIGTTMIYAETSQVDVKNEHRKYVV